MRCGLTVSEYNDMTPRELRLVAEIHGERLNREREDRITQAYLTAAWYRSKKLPRLEQILKKQPQQQTPKQQTPEEMLDFAKRLQARLDRG